MLPRSLLALIAIFAGSHTGATAQSPVVLEDFERYVTGSVPDRWRMPDQRLRRMVPIPPDHAQPNDYVRVTSHGDGKVLRAYTRDASVQIGLPWTDGLDWDLGTHPRLSWRWKADQLPDGAREDQRGKNDTGAAVYVAFDCNDVFRRPCTLKYTYSDALPVGSVVRYGRLWVMVVSSAADQVGTWTTIERSVPDDYRQLFGTDPPGNPIYIMLWGDSDNTGTVSDVYFDDLILLPSAE